MAIYTKKGDKGRTSLYTRNGVKRRVSKDSAKIEAIGSIDELNSYLGVAASFGIEEVGKIIKDLQRDLLIVGSILAGSDLKFSKRKTEKLEVGIDLMEEDLPELTNFIIPGGENSAALLQYARSLARRSERRVVAFNKLEKVDPNVLTFLNRLSDFLFVFSRKINYMYGEDEEKWMGKS